MRDGHVERRTEAGFFTEDPKPADLVVVNDVHPGLGLWVLRAVVNPPESNCRSSSLGVVVGGIAQP